MQGIVARPVISVFSDVRTLHFAELLQLGHAGVRGLISPPSVLLLDTAAASVQESPTNVPYLLEKSPGWLLPIHSPSRFAKTATRLAGCIGCKTLLRSL